MFDFFAFKTNSYKNKLKLKVKWLSNYHQIGKVGWDWKFKQVWVSWFDTLNYLDWI